MISAKEKICNNREVLKKERVLKRASTTKNKKKDLPWPPFLLDSPIPEQKFSSALILSPAILSLASGKSACGICSREKRTALSFNWFLSAEKCLRLECSDNGDHRRVLGSQGDILFWCEGATSRELWSTEVTKGVVGLLSEGRW